MGNVVSWLAQCFYPDDQVFWAAAHYGDAGMIQLATSRLSPETRKYLEWQEPDTGRTPLLEAVAQGHCECARLLIQAGANCNAKDLKMNTPLHLACKRARLEMVTFLLQVSAVNPFEINFCMKTPLDLARSRFVEEEEEADGEAAEFQLYAKCIEVLEKKICLYSGWLYTKTDNVLSLVSGISSLNSWTRRFCMVLERGDPTVLELALFRMKNGSGVRPVCPTSVMLYNVAAGMEATTDPRWFSPKDFTFLVRADQWNKCHYRASSAIQNPVHFAAIDQASFDAWRALFIHQQERLAEMRCVTVNREDTSAGCNPRSMVPASSQSTLPPNFGLDETQDIRRAIGLSFQTASQTENELGSTDATLLPVSAPDWEDQDECEWIGNAAETIEGRTDVEASYASEQNTLAYSFVGECVICFDGPQSAVCVPCGHNAMCMKCAEEIQTSTAECPVCRAHIRELIKLYK